MKKVNKKNILSAKYKEWESLLEKDGKRYPKYKSSNKYYYDIVMNLFYCQNGLCAYTEVLLCSELYYNKNNWTLGKYNCPDSKLKPEFKGQLDHFDASLKSKKIDKDGKQDWLWDNFFMVDSDTNREKGTKIVDNILKPDTDNFDPKKTFDYNLKTNCFIPHKNVTIDEHKRILQMINILGINHSAIIRKREIKIKETETFLKFGKDWSDIKITEFPTAIEFYKEKKRTSK